MKFHDVLPCIEFVELNEYMMLVIVEICRDELRANVFERDDSKNKCHDQNVRYICEYTERMCVACMSIISIQFSWLCSQVRTIAWWRMGLTERIDGDPLSCTDSIFSSPADLEKITILYEKYCVT